MYKISALYEKETRKRRDRIVGTDMVRDILNGE
jgi:hypothetical protein